MSSLAQGIAAKAAQDTAACIGCRECLAVCPVAPADLRIADLNLAVAGGAPPGPEAVTTFATECLQCGRCVPVCPAGLERDVMTLWQRANLPHLAPGAEDHLRHLGGGQPVARRVEVVLHNLRHRARLKGLARYVDKRVLRSADTLFFFGCNIFSDTGLPAKVLALADYLDIRYEVLGGLSNCCGWSHHLAGDTDRAERLMDHLHERIGQVRPKEVVTIGAECYAALKRLVAVKDAGFTPVTATSWVRRNLHRFPIRRASGNLTFHDACHVSRKLGEGEEARRVLRQFGGFVEMRDHGEDATCCGFHQYNANPEQLKALREARVAMAGEAGADTLVTECVRCQESFAAAGEAAGVRVVDVIDLVFEAVMDDDNLSPQPVHFKSPIRNVSRGAAPAEGT